MLRYMSSWPKFSPYPSIQRLLSRPTMPMFDSTPLDRSWYSMNLDRSLPLVSVAMPPTVTWPAETNGSSAVWAKAGTATISAAHSGCRLRRLTEVTVSTDEELTAARGRIGAVNRVMAVHAGPRDEARVDRRIERAWSLAEAGAVLGIGGRRRRALEPGCAPVDRARVALDVVAVLAEVRHLFVQEPGVDGPMRVVAGQAVLLNRRVRKHEGTALVGVARIALLVDCLGAQH